MYYFVSLTTPNFLRISSIKHHFVNEDWSRFKPTNAVNKYHEIGRAHV